MSWALVRRRTLWVPTWKGSLLLLVTLVVGGTATLNNLYPFLAINTPLPEVDLLVVDGWVSDEIMRVAANELADGRADWVCATGVEVNPGELFTEHASWAELGGDTLKLLGVPDQKLLIANAGGGEVHRTFESAMAVKRVIGTRGISVNSINILTEGCHARRSRMVYRKVFGEKVALGVIAESPGGYNGDAWWKSSNGFKIVLMEVIALGYEWLADGGR